MASPGELVKAMAQVLGISVATVRHCDRQLSEANLRSRRGRGISAAEVTSQDAANLLISIMASQHVKEAVQACKLYGQLRVEQSEYKNWKLFGLVSLSELPRGHLLGHALAATIEGAGKGESLIIPGKPLEKVYPYTIDDQLSVEFDGPDPRASIGAISPILQSENDEDSIVDVTMTYSKKGSASRKGDLDRSSRITFRTIRALGSLLGKGA